TEQPIGTVRRDSVSISGSYNERQPARIEGEEVMGGFDPLKDFDGVVLGSVYLGRPMSLVNAISKAQEDIQGGIDRRRKLYVAALAAVSVIIGVGIASVFSKRITKQIDQLRKGADTISDGNLDYRLRINSGDENEVLAEQFNAMAAKLHDSYQTLEKKVE